MLIKITTNDNGNPPGKLADAEIHFTDGPLAGLKLIGFSIWERRSGNGRNVTFPARQYQVNGERRSFALLRPIVDATAQDRIRDLILDAYAQVERQQYVNDTSQPAPRPAPVLGFTSPTAARILDEPAPTRIEPTPTIAQMQQPPIQAPTIQARAQATDAARGINVPPTKPVTPTFDF